jgi:hypothetical protein
VRRLTTHIQSDIVLYQTKEVLYQGPGIMKELMPRYLHQRMRKRFGVYEILLSMVANMHAYLCAEFGFEQYQAQEDCMAYLCEGIHKILGPGQIAAYLWGSIGEHEIINSHLKQSQAVIRPRDKLTAAAAVKAYSLVSGILSQLSDLDAKREQPPLEMTVRQEDNELLRLILEHLASLSGDGVRDIWESLGFSIAITRALVAGNNAHAKLILAGIHRAHVEPESRIYSNWLSLALKPKGDGMAKDHELVGSVLSIRPPNAPKVFANRFKDVCDLGDYELAKILAAHMDLNRGIVRNRPIHSAISTKNLNLIGAVIDAGADVNYRAYKRDKLKDQKESEREAPIEMTMGFGKEVLGYLIHRGALIPPLSAWMKGDRHFYNILRNAVFDYQVKKKSTYSDFYVMTKEENVKY